MYVFVPSSTGGRDIGMEAKYTKQVQRLGAACCRAITCVKRRSIAKYTLSMKSPVIHRAYECAGLVILTVMVVAVWAVTN